MTERKSQEQLFDKWPETYDRWFITPIGELVRKYEGELLLDLLKPSRGETILDAGCGTAVFTLDILSSGARVIGLDLSLPMLHRARQKTRRYPLQLVLGDIVRLPFPEKAFDKVVSVTALEFVADGEGAVRELFRVAKKGGTIVVATLNSLSPWASRRKTMAQRGHALFQNAIFRSPDELGCLAPVEGIIQTAVHFQKEDDPAKVPEIEMEARNRGLNTGAFLAARWRKP